MKELSLLIICFFLVRCTKPGSVNPIVAESVIADSFQINNVQSLSEFLTFRRLNDSTLLGFDMQNAEFNYYIKKQGSSSFERKTHLEVKPRHYLPGFFTDQEGIYYTLDINGPIYKYNKELELIDTLNPQYLLPYLKSEFKFFNYNYSPLIKHGDTIISAIVHKNANDFLLWTKEFAMMEYVQTGNLPPKVKCFMRKPANLKDYMQPWPSYCYVDNTLVAIYAPFDTVYTYNRQTGEEKKIALDNANYRLPEISDSEKLSATERPSYQTKYALANFRYNSIFYNDATQHYVLIYVIPAESKDKDKALTFDDQPNYALVLDKKFNTLGHFRFERSYLDFSNYFIYPGKGLAMPLYNPKGYESTQFYIYNF
ncbi:MAG: hypothetical protein ACJ76F_01610 [Bacteroidia bacterium]